MGRRKRKVGTVKENGGSQDKISAERAERNRATYKRFYQNHPEIREQKRVLMAKMRAEKKAARRRWDPPKREIRKALNLTPPPVSLYTPSYLSATEYQNWLNNLQPSTPSHGDSDDDRINLRARSVICDVHVIKSADQSSVACHSRTSGEHLAILALAELAQGQPMENPISDTDSVLALAMQLSSSGSSMRVSGRASKLTPPAVVSSAEMQSDEQGITLPAGVPGSVQDLMRRGIKHTPNRMETSRLMVAHNSGPLIAAPTAAEIDRWGDAHNPPKPPTLKTMGMARWDELYFWSEAVMLLDPTNDWDRATQLAFARARKTA
ncbi:hypothetical protein FB451DRAFT_1565486 [Mycena latifolia]|nr:hypothetical protein FB451DRAFT_1565486 [Mycena latifolia]